MILDMQNLERGFKLSLDLNVRPLFFNVNIKDNWGFGLDIANITVYGNIDISGNLLLFKETENEKFGPYAAAYADVGIPVFFHLRDIIWDRDLKITFRPAGYVPLIYTEPGMRYSFVNYYSGDSRGSRLELDVGADVYTVFSLDNEADIISSLNISSAIGIDFSIGAEYPLYSWIDVGVNFINIPLSASRLTHLTRINEELWLDTTEIKIEDILSGDKKLGDYDYENLSVDFKPEYLDRTDGINKKVFRPFKMLLHANYRPFETQLLTLIPTLGFSVNPFFLQKTSIETGIKARCDLVNIFVTTIGIVYEDQMWKNGIDFILNLRAMELGFGIAMQSQRFGKSWQAAGLRANVGLKFGF
jgi:hypothetical protein